MHTLFEDYINQFAYYGYHVSLNTFDNPVRFGNGMDRKIGSKVLRVEQLTAPRPEGRGFPFQRTEPKPRVAIQDLQALRGLTLPARQL